MFPSSRSFWPTALFSIGLITLCIFPLATQAADWSQFRGGDGTNYVPEASLPSEWSDSDYAWQFDLSSSDVGTPVVSNGTVFLLSGDVASAERRIVAIDLATGKLRWEQRYPASPSHLHNRNTYGSSTPVANDKHVFFSWAEPDHTWLRCLTHDGDEVWARDFGTWKSQHGFGTSPTLIGDLLVLFDSQQADQLPADVPPGQSRMIALNPSSGETVWETPLTTTRVCYGVPALFTTADGQRQIVAANTGDGLFGLDYATGKKLWNNRVFKARCVSTPLVAGDLVIGSAGSGGGGNHLVAVRPTGDSAEEVYRVEKGAPYVPTPAMVKGDLFLVDDKGIASCIDATTGERRWLKRVGGTYSASPIVLGDRMLIVSLTGEATVLAAAPTFEKISSFDLGGPVGATPVYSDGKLLLRIGTRLCCLPTP